MTKAVSGNLIPLRQTIDQTVFFFQTEFYQGKSKLRLHYLRKQWKISQVLLQHGCAHLPWPSLPTKTGWYICSLSLSLALYGDSMRNEPSRTDAWQRDWMNSHHTGPISKCRSPRCGFIQVNDDGEDGRDNAGLCPPMSLVRLIGDPACCAVALQHHRCCSSHIWTQHFQDFHINFVHNSSESIVITVTLKSISLVHFYVLCFDWQVPPTYIWILCCFYTHCVLRALDFFILLDGIQMNSFVEPWHNKNNLFCLLIFFWRSSIHPLC